jgi:hypothetical protein
MKPFYFLLATCLWLLFANCKSFRTQRVVAELTQERVQSIPDRFMSDSIQIQYIGCGGFFIRHGQDGLLIDPYFSNAAALAQIKSDTNLIDNFFKQLFNEPKDAEGLVKMTLISHAHHDHLADLPSLYRRNLNQVALQIVGSETAANIFKAFQMPLPRQFHSFDTVFKNNKKATPSVFSANRRIRVTVLLTEHAPHLWKFKIPFIGGSLISIPRKKPRTTFGYKEGMNYSFMIDFLNEQGESVFRIFANAGAAANAPIGFPPPSVLAGKNVDLLLVCAASFQNVKGYPEKLVAHTQPSKIFIAHWEDFFKPIPELIQKPRVVTATNIPKFISRLKKEMTRSGMTPKPIIVSPLTSVVFRF